MTIGLTTDNTSRWKQAFLLALLIAGLIFLPFVIMNKGYFIYYGDFNVQQIPFYQLAHEAVRSWDIGWSWHTDLGANFIGSYSFYLLFSPFFWLTLPFPTWFLPYLMAPLLVLKTACASLTACLYLERFVRDKRYAVIGALLYAFSGWMFFNIFFNHFHDVTVFFPLLLIAVEKLVQEGKTGLVAIIVMVCAIVNYWFFVGEAVFVVLYVLVRMTDRSFTMTAPRFLKLAFESLLGVGLAAFVILPSVMAIMGNPRTGSDELLTGWRFWLYWHEQRQPAIIQSLFFPPELPARPNYLADHGAKWASLSGWLPLFGMSGVLAYFFSRHRDWLKKLLTLCLVMALVPGLNSLFILLNHSYYARWFYMPILLMAMATVRALEDCRVTTAHYHRGLCWSLGISVLFVVMCGLTPNKSDGQWRLGMYQYTAIFWVYAIGVLVCIGIVSLLVLYLARHRHFTRFACGALAALSIAFGIFYISNGRYSQQRADTFINTAVKARDLVSLPARPFARVDVYDGPDNIAMFWGQPTIQAFHSVVPPSIMDFYPTVGVTRDVGSRPEVDFPALRPLLSVRWLYINQTGNEDESPMAGYQKRTEEVGYYVYENENYIPMGFGYRQYVTRSQLEQTVDKAYRSNLMLRAVVLEDEDLWRFDRMLEWMETDGVPLNFSDGDMAQDAAERREQAAETFAITKKGFTAFSRLEEETLLFFSVPWEEGWSATVNGAEAQIWRVNLGFMGVVVPYGEAKVVFTYRTPGLFTGLLVTGGSLVVLLLYLVLARLLRKGRAAGPSHLDLASSAGVVRMSWEEYAKKYGDKRSRTSHLQRTLNEASQRRIPQSLPDEEQTLRFNFPDEGNTKEDNNDKNDNDPASL